MLYIVGHSDWDSYDPQYVEGPEVPDWEAFCKSLLGEAAEAALAYEASGHNSWCGYPEVIENLVHVLEGCGYKKVHPPKFRLFGSIIIDEDGDGAELPEDIRAKIIAHNKQVHSGLYDEADA
jgi:hypothetical protein